MAKSVTWKTVKGYLLSKTEGVPDHKVPVGAQVPAWMLWQKPPNDFYNEVYPGILLGGDQMASKPEELKELGVTHVVNCAMGTKSNQINTDQKFFADSGINFHGIRAIDILTFKMAPHFEKAIDFIDEAMGNEGKVYVHCVSGVSRSATIVIAFLMSKRRMRVMEAVKRLREKRRILPNDGFLRELVELDKQLYGDQT